MPDTPTPGQVAYMAYWAHETPTLSPELIAFIWRGLRPLTQASWDAVAQAVLAQSTPQEDAHA